MVAEDLIVYMTCMSIVNTCPHRVWDCLNNTAKMI